MSRRITKNGTRVIDRIRQREDENFSREHEMRSHDRQLDDLFEKLYFHEIDGRDKVYQRIQFPVVSFIAVAGFVGTMLQNVRRGDLSAVGIIFWVVLGFAILSLVGAAVFLVLSAVGRKYKYLPVPESWQEYQKTCTKLYKDFDMADRLVSAALKKNLVEAYIYCATINGGINEKRAYHVFMLLRFLISGAIFTFVAYSIFYCASLDKNLQKRAQTVEIVNPITVKGVEMANSKPVPPPPPPPPPAREIREDRRPPNVPSPPKPHLRDNHGSR